MGVLIERRERVMLLTLDRPPLNVLDIPLLRDLDDTLKSVAGERGTDLVVLRGGGERAFSAGVDIRDHTPDKVPEMLKTVHRVIRRLFALPQVTIASVRGVCLGGGCELATSCDFIIAARDSVFATPEILVGCYPPVALARFPALVGYHRAAEMILNGRRLSAREALAVGMINRVVPSRQLDEGLEAFLGELLQKSSAVLRVAVKGLRELSLRTFDSALERSEQIYLEELMRTEDIEEGVKAFLEKRPARWKHR